MKSDNKFFVFIYLPTSELYLVEDLDGGLHFVIPTSLEKHFSVENVNLFFLNNSECLGEL